MLPLDSAGDVLSNGIYKQVRQKLLDSLDKKKWAVDPASVVENARLQGAKQMLHRFHKMFELVRTKQIKENIKNLQEVRELDSHLF